MYACVRVLGKVVSAQGGWTIAHEEDEEWLKRYGQLVAASESQARELRPCSVSSGDQANPSCASEESCGSSI